MRSDDETEHQRFVLKIFGSLWREAGRESNVHSVSGVGEESRCCYLYDCVAMIVHKKEWLAKLAPSSYFVIQTELKNISSNATWFFLDCRLGGKDSALHYVWSGQVLQLVLAGAQAHLRELVTGKVGDEERGWGGGRRATYINKTRLSLNTMEHVVETPHRTINRA